MTLGDKWTGLVEREVAGGRGEGGGSTPGREPDQEDVDCSGGGQGDREPLLISTFIVFERIIIYKFSVGKTSGWEEN